MKITIPNVLNSATSKSLKAAGKEDSGSPSLKLNYRFEAGLATSSRSSATTKSQQTLKRDEIVEIELSDGSIWFATQEDLKELNANRSSRGKGTDFVIDNSMFHLGAESRGLMDGISAIRIGSAPSMKHIRDWLQNHIDLTEIDKKAKQWLKDKGLSVATSFASDILAAGLGAWIDQQNEAEGKSELRFVRPVGKTLATTSIDQPLAETKKPWLLFIHGTFSSTHRAFHKIWQEHSRFWSQLKSVYGDRIIALEHPTLTESPVQNALIAAQQLPAGADLHIVSHSRGGLVGELLCRATRETAAPFTDEELEAYRFATNKTSMSLFAILREIQNSIRGQYPVSDAEALSDLNDLLARKQIKVSRFVRVACPARGTTLASERSHRWLNRFMNVLGATGLKASPMYSMVQSLLVGVLRSATDVAILPGLNAQKPDSGLVRILNAPSTDPVKADLSVVSGDVEATGWKKYPLWIADRFFGGSHDLVVNTASMDGGSKRSKKILEYPVEANHLEYFSNSTIVGEIVNRLQNKPSEFAQKWMPNEVVIPRSKRPAAHSGRDRDPLVLVPGVMGSTLQKSGSPIWVSYWRLMWGGLSELSDLANEKIVADGLYEDAYAEFVQRFSGSHQVVQMAYDWRKPLSDSADRLEQTILDLLDSAPRKPIRIVAHSMGGLVVRRWIEKHKETWELVKQHDGSRVIMAGTPNAGSYGTLRTLVGHDRTIKSLALLDLTQSLDELLVLVRRFPGVLNLLPKFGKLDWFKTSNWKKLHRTLDDFNWDDDIDADNLIDAEGERKKLTPASIDPDKMIYIAGVDEKTPSDLSLEDGELQFQFTDAGDGQVTWNSGIPKELTKVWYQDSTHGDLLSDKEFFDAWEQLIDTGETNMLDSTPPRATKRSGMLLETHGELLPDVVDYLPTERELARSIMGSSQQSTRGRTTSKTLLPSLDITVTHGDLSYSQYPVAVGHYEGDSIIHAEKVLDNYLDKRLSRRFQAEQYPGPIGTSDVVFRKSKRNYPEGALVIGLGRFGTLTGTLLERTLTAAITNYVIECNEAAGVFEDDEAIGLSMLMVGSGIGGVSVHDSLRCILGAAQAANKRIRKISPALKLLKRIEIVELWEDLAHAALHSLVRRSSDLRNENIHVTSELQYRNGGQSRTFDAADQDWWDTISVRSEDDSFVFNNFTRYARNEVSREPVEIERVDRYIDQIISHIAFQQNARVSPNRTLFEIVLPNYIKENSLDTDRLRLLLDEDAARIPWEMLIDGWSDKPVPLAVSKQLIRQLNTEDFRPSPQRAEGRRALVIGDPPGPQGYARLPGARAEAKVVADCLEQETDYIVERVIAKGTAADASMPTAIINELMSQEHSIIHFAAHGIYDPDSKGKSGMIIGPKNNILTANDVNKLRRVPTLVFLNCCHLGFIRGTRRGKRRQIGSGVPYNRVAANLATAFIRIGTKAVIAAGWEVHDYAAQRFASEFYRQFVVQRVALGEAVQKARKATYDDYPSTNTFGAYQCWGDPDFSLRFTATRRSSSHPNIYVSPKDFETEAYNIRHTARAASRAQIMKLCERANRLRGDLFGFYGNPLEGTSKTKSKRDESKWINPATKALVALARAYGEIGMYDQAILLLHKARELHVSALSFRDLEQLANFQCRYALDVFRSSKDKDSDKVYATDLIRHGVSLLDEIVQQYGVDASPTAYREVYCLIGSASRRKAVTCETKDEVVEELTFMCEYYGYGWTGTGCSQSAWDGFRGDLKDANAVAKFAVEQNIEPVDYAFTNYILGSAIRDWFEDKVTFKPNNKATKNILNKHVELTETRATRATHFWAEVGQSDLLLAQLVDEGIRKALRDPETPKNQSTAQELDSIFERLSKTYEDARKRFGSARQWLSIFDLVLFVRKMIDKALAVNEAKRKKTTADKRLIKNLNDALPYVRKLEASLASHAGKDIHRPTPEDNGVSLEEDIDTQIRAFLVEESRKTRKGNRTKSTTKRSSKKKNATEKKAANKATSTSAKTTTKSSTKKKTVKSGNVKKKKTTRGASKKAAKKVAAKPTSKKKAANKKAAKTKKQAKKKKS